MNVVQIYNLSSTLRMEKIISLSFNPYRGQIDILLLSAHIDCRMNMFYVVDSIYDHFLFIYIEYLSIHGAYLKQYRIGCSFLSEGVDFDSCNGSD
jgi:hypothetical protein